MNTALCPVPRLQFSDANGVPLAGGFLFSYAAGTTTPLATYQDSLGAAANTNPIVLDSSGSASIWLSAALYKLVLQDALGVQQWTQDNVSAVSLGELQGIASFASLTIAGNATVGGNLEVDGILTAATATITGTVTAATLAATSSTISGNENVGGALSAGSAGITGDETIGGTLTVTGATALSTLTVGGTDISALITSLIPALVALDGTLIITNVATAGNWVIFTFGATVGSRVRIALGGGGGLANGATIALPAGFTSSQLIATVSVGANAATPGNQISQWACSVTAGVVTVTSADTLGHNFTPTANWFGVTWQTGY